MPEETIKYKIELDPSDLSQQLADVRNQIDSVLGAGSAAPSMAFGASNIFNDSGFGTISGDPGFMSTMSNMVDRVGNMSQQGFSMFSADMRRLGNLFPSSVPDFALPGLGGRGQFTGGALGGLWAGATGAGFDPYGAYTRSEYIGQAFNQAFGDDSFMREWLFTGIGAAVGGLPGAGIGGLLDLGAGLVGGNTRQRNVIAGGLQELFRATSGGGVLGVGESRDITRNLMNRVSSFEGRLAGYDLGEIQGDILAYAQGGGFQGADPAELDAKIASVMENTRQVARSLGVMHEEASRIIGELESKQITTMGGAEDFAGRMFAAGRMTGLAPTDVISTGLRGVQMARGIQPEAAFGMAIDARTQAAEMARGTAFERELITGMGGPDAAAMSMMQGGLNYMGSPMGQMYLASIMGGGGRTPGMSDLLGGAANTFGTVEGYLGFVGAGNRVMGTVMSFQDMNIEAVNQAMNTAQSIGMDITDPAQLMGLMVKTNPGLTADAAGAMISSAIADPMSRVATQNLLVENRARMENRGPIFGPAGVEGLSFGTAKKFALMGGGAGALGFFGGPVAGGIGVAGGAAIGGIVGGTYDVLATSARGLGIIGHEVGDWASDIGREFTRNLSNIFTDSYTGNVEDPGTAGFINNLLGTDLFNILDEDDTEAFFNELEGARDNRVVIKHGSRSGHNISKAGREMEFVIVRGQKLNQWEQDALLNQRENIMTSVGLAQEGLEDIDTMGLTKGQMDRVKIGAKHRVIGTREILGQGRELSVNAAAMGPAQRKEMVQNILKAEATAGAARTVRGMFPGFDPSQTPELQSIQNMMAAGQYDGIGLLDDIINKGEVFNSITARSTEKIASAISELGAKNTGPAMRVIIAEDLE